MERLRELRGPDTRERDLANILGFEHSRAVRWKEGQMYVDRAEYLVRLADALDVETMLLVAMASGTLTVEQAHRQLASPSRGEDKKRRGGATRAEPLEIASDASTFAVDSGRFEAGARGVVLLIATNGEGRAELGAALARHPEVSGLVATSRDPGDGSGGALSPRDRLRGPGSRQRPCLRGLSGAVQPDQPRAAAVAGSSPEPRRSPTRSRSRP